MLRSMKAMENYTIGATDGVIGHVKDFYFDDKAWAVRYLVVETGDWLSQRRVLLSPMAIGEPNWNDRIFPVSITKAQVKASPAIDTDKPVSRQQEEGFLDYYGYPYYWGGDSLWGGGLYPNGMILENCGAMTSAAGDSQAPMARDAVEASAGAGSHDDPHLRSGNTVTSYNVRAKDGDIGHVQGLLVDEKTWAIRYMIVNTRNWWLGHEVLIAPDWIENIDWVESKVLIDLTRDSVKDSPPYDSATPLSRDLETGTYKHYGRDSYWPREARHEAARARP